MHHIVYKMILHVLNITSNYGYNINILKVQYLQLKNRTAHYH